MSNKFQEITQDIQSRINDAAYMMWESAGRQQGMAMEYWLKAEKEVLSTLHAAASQMLPSQRKVEDTPAAPTTAAAAPAEPVAEARPAIEAPKAAAAPAVAAPKPAAETRPAASPAPRKAAARGKAKS